VFFPKWRGPKDWRWRYQMLVLLLVLAIGVEQAFAWPSFGAVGVLTDAALIAMAGAATVWWWRCWRAPR
jgi:hypothetical protein